MSARLTERGELVIGHLTARGRAVIGRLTGEGRAVSGAAAPIPPIPPIPPPTPPIFDGGGASGTRRQIWIDRPQQTAHTHGAVGMRLGAAGAVRSEHAVMGGVAVWLSAAGAVRSTQTARGAAGLALSAQGIAVVLPGDSADELWLLGLEG